MSSALPATVRRIRHERGLTIEGLAFASGLSVSTVQRIETGKHSPSVATLALVAEALNVPSADLLVEQVAS